MVGKRGRKEGVRNKVRQVLLIKGKPEFLYRKKVYKIVELTLSGKKYNLGHINADLHDILRKIEGASINIYEKESTRTVGIEGFKSLHIRKAGENTTIEVSALNEEELSIKVETIKNYLKDKGVLITERCSWECTVDKAKELKSSDNKNEISKIDENNVKDNIKDKNDIKKLKIEKKTQAKIRKSKKTKELREMVARMGIDNIKDIDYEKARKIKKHI